MGVEIRAVPRAVASAGRKILMWPFCFLNLKFGFFGGSADFEMFSESCSLDVDHCRCPLAYPLLSGIFSGLHKNTRLHGFQG